MTKVAKIYLDRCIEVAGDARSGVLLHRIALWNRSTKVKFGGYRWATSTRQQWAEQTETTFKKVRNDLDKLTAKKLIHRERHLFAGRPALFVRLTEDAEVQLSAPADWLISRGYSRASPNGTERMAPVGAKRTAPTGSMLYKHTSETQLEKQKEEAPANAAAVTHPAGSVEKAFGKVSKQALASHSNALSFPKTEHASSENDQVESAVVTIAEIGIGACDDTYAAMAKLDSMKPDQPATLIAIWQDEYKTLGLPPAVFSYAEKAGIKAILASIPAGAGPEFIRTAVQRWAEVVEIAERDFGAYKPPANATIAATCKYASAVQMVMGRTIKKAKAVQSIALNLTAPNAKKAAHDQAFLDWQMSKAAKVTS